MPHPQSLPPTEPTDDNDTYPPPCINPSGHVWVVSEEDGRSTASTASPTATPDVAANTRHIDFLLGLPTLADNVLWRTAHRLGAPGLISVNAL